jgi:pilus assembly protein Flp/PilA
MVKNFITKLKSEEGQGLVEYALILVLVAIAVYAALQALGTNVGTTFTKIGGYLK